jgi:hypothetical protein
LPLRQPTTAETEFSSVNPGNDIVGRRRVVPCFVSIPVLDLYLNHDAQDFNDLNY